jgi:tetratricopeptide (TPR) repeat protein
MAEMEQQEHVPEELLGRFLRAEVSKQEGRRVVRHLATGCQQCTELMRGISAHLGPWSEGQAGWEEAYEEVFLRALAFASREEQRIALERLLGWGQWAGLEPLSPETRSALVESDGSYHTFGLYDRLLEASRLYVRREPAEAVDVVRLAVLVAERLDPERHGKARVADLRASAWAELGNAKRLASDFEGARGAFNEAWRILEEEGTNDPLEQAHLLSLEASYMNDMGEFETAETALEDALDTYRRIGDTHRQGRILLKMGDAIGHVDPARGLGHIRKALSLIDATEEPRLQLCAQHDCAWYLNDCGQPTEALAVLEQARPLYRQFPDVYTQLRLHWLEGRISFNLDQLDHAESTFRQLWEELRSRDLNHELVLLSIDLAEVLVRKGQPNRAAELVEECVPILTSWRIHTDALAAWIVFQQALARQQVEGVVFDRVRQYFRRHWIRPAELEL